MQLPCIGDLEGTYLGVEESSGTGRADTVYNQTYVAVKASNYIGHTFQQTINIAGNPFINFVEADRGRGETSTCTDGEYRYSKDVSSNTKNTVIAFDGDSIYLSHRISDVSMPPFYYKTIIFRGKKVN